MKASIKELEIREGFKIREGSIVELDFWNDGKPLEVKVDEIVMEDGEVYIESYTTGYGNPVTHSASQYRHSGKLIKY